MDTLSFKGFRAALRYWTAEHPSVSRFRWSQDTFGASWTFLAFSVPCYLIMVFILKLLLSFRKRPVPLGPIPAIHNLVLTIGSLVMFIGCWQAAMVEMQHNRWIWGGSKRKTGMNWLLCFPIGTRPTGRVFFWSYVYYLSKYYELFDTAILLLRKKPLTFLHVFHHSMVLLMCFFWLQFTQSLQVVALLTNTAVHVVMYFYYFLCSAGIYPPWKRLVTNCQIIQFLFSFAVSLGLLKLHFRGQGCSGVGAWMFNAVFNLLLLVLFMNYHSKQYGRRKSQGANKQA